VFFRELYKYRCMIDSHVAEAEKGFV